MTENKTGAGRPQMPEHDGTKEGKALANLQYRLDRACVAINDHTTQSVSSAFGRAAKAGVPSTAGEAVIQAMEAAIQDAREALERAYAAPEAKPAYEPRLTLVA